MKLLQRYILTLSTTLICLCASASVEVDGIFYELHNNGAATVTFLRSNGHSYSGDVAIPASISHGARKYKVTAIGRKAFCNCPNLIAVTIPNTVTNIDESAFYGCSSLATLKLPDAVEQIEDFAFGNCTSLVAVSIGGNVKEIGADAFSGCNSLSAVFINNLSSWCKIKFANNKANPLSQDASLYLNKRPITHLVIPADITSMLDYSFYGCRNIASVTIPKSVKHIGVNAFSGCSMLNIINIEDVEAWMDIKHNDLETFCDGCDFYLNGEKLVELIIPESITVVPRGCFKGCKSIETIVMHENVSIILQDAFNGCWNVRRIVCKSEVPPVCGSKALDGVSRSKCTLSVPEGCELVYKNAAIWNEFNIVKSEE